MQLREQPGLCSVPCDGVSALCHVAVPVLCAMCRCFVPCHCMCQQQEQQPIPPQGTQTHRHGLELCSSAGSSWALCALSPCRGAEAGAAPMLYSHTAVPPVQGCWLGALSSACAACSDAVGDTAEGLPVLGAAAVQRSAVTDSVLLHQLGLGRVWFSAGGVWGCCSSAHSLPAVQVQPL